VLVQVCPALDSDVLEWAVGSSRLRGSDSGDLTEQDPLEERVVALEDLEEQLRRRVTDLDVLVEGFHARIDAILSRMDEAANKVASLADSLSQVEGALRPK
jgi:hypothetical protein